MCENRKLKRKEKKMRKLLTVFVAVLLVLTFVSFAAAQESDPVFDNPPGDMKWVPGGLPWALFIPHYTVTGGWWSGLCLQNMSGIANMYKIYFCGNSGYVTGTVEGALTGYEKVAWMLTYAMCGSSEGWIVVESQMSLLGFINYGQSDSVTTLGPFFSF